MIINHSPFLFRIIFIIFTVMSSIRKRKKEIKKSPCQVLQGQALESLRMVRVWKLERHSNSKSNMRILTGNFIEKGKLMNDGFWWNCNDKCLKGCCDVEFID